MYFEVFLIELTVSSPYHLQKSFIYTLNSLVVFLTKTIWVLINFKYNYCANCIEILNTSSD